MNQWKSAHAAETKARTLADAMKGADVFFGLSAKGAVTKDMVGRMADKPIIFAMANPDPEITPEEVRAVRSDAIIATGRSDYPNQVNNVLGFPYIFRGALDVRASTINEEMKIAAAEALAALAREDVPDEVDARLCRAAPALRAGLHHSGAVRPAADRRGAAGGGAGGDGDRRGAPADRRTWRSTRTELSARLDPTADALQRSSSRVREQSAAAWSSPRARRRRSIRAAVAFRNAGYGEPILIGREDRVARHDERPRPRRGDGHRDRQRPARQPQRALHRVPVSAACSARATSTATASAW